ncbi:MAG: 2-enoyl thioester reductase domain-containing protein [Verrucomicrobiae bacterium]|nr:2-enoyl thioester reductase domain-containing protein [Verrucomicrobiae bacterium]NNJ42772.1 zinc-binding dehydrogenase [Akkermansiaceae bacterium]
MPQHASFTSYGQPEEVIQLIDTPSPALRGGEVRIKMLAAPVNPADINLIQGIYGIRPELPATAGLEGCGKVIESQSTDFHIGDKVIFTQRAGTWSDEVISSAAGVLKIPADTPSQQAAMLKVNPLTAWCMLTQLRKLPKGSWVIQNAANSGVGYCVIQIAQLLGLKTINLVRRDELIPELKKIGGDICLLDNTDYIDIIKDKQPELALNAVGGDSALRLMDALAPQGLHVTYGAMSRRSLKVPNKFLIFKRIQLHGFWVTQWIKENDPAIVCETYQKLAQWMIDQNLSQPIDSSFPLDHIHDAITRANQDKRAGKVIISMNE